MLTRLIAILAILAVATGDASALPVCRGADVESLRLIATLGRYTSDTTGGNMRVRDSLRLPALAASQVVLVTTESVCKKANAAYQSSVAGTGGTGLTGRVYVIKIGDRYAVLDPGYNYGESGNWTVVILDSHYNYLATY
jgi:hypothetical protein